MEIRSRIIKQQGVRWRELAWLQGDLKKTKKSSFQKLKESLRVNSFVMAFHVWEDKKNDKIWILDGHHRQRAMVELEKEGAKIPEELPAEFIDIKNIKEARKMVLVYSAIYATATPETLYEYIVKNELDFNALKNEVDMPDINMKTFEAGWMKDEIIEDTPPEPVKRAFTKSGDLYTLGKHTLLCGDSTKPDDVKRLLDGKKADLCLTDPPYGINLEYEKQTDSRENLVGLISGFLPLARANATVTLVTSGLKNLWLYPESNWVLCWYYGAGQFRSPWGFNCWQPVLCYGKDPYLTNGLGSRADAIDMNTPAMVSEIDHPCPKPLKFWSWLITRATIKERSTVLDLFAGAGTTLIACEQLKYTSYCLEIEPRYCDVVIKRYVSFCVSNKRKPVVLRNGKDETSTWMKRANSTAPAVHG